MVMILQGRLWRYLTPYTKQSPTHSLNPRVSLISREKLFLVEVFQRGTIILVRSVLHPQLHIVIMGAVTEQAWCTDLKVMLQEVTNSAHACSIGPRYLKCLIPKKKETREFFECLNEYSEAIHAHMSPSYTKGNHRPWRLKKKRKKKIMKANKKSNKCVRGLTITRLVDSVVHDTNMELHTLVSPRLHFEISHQSANQRPH